MPLNVLLMTVRKLIVSQYLCDWMYCHFPQKCICLKYSPEQSLGSSLVQGICMKCLINQVIFLDRELRVWWPALPRWLDPVRNMGMTRESRPCGPSRLWNTLKFISTFSALSTQNSSNFPSSTKKFIRLSGKPFQVRIPSYINYQCFFPIFRP